MNEGSEKSQKAEHEYCEQLLYLDDNKDALTWRIRLIKMARKELILSTFDFIGDSSGLNIISALLNAQTRGVHIMILMDGMNGYRRLSSCSAFWYLASLDNVEVRYYNPIRKLPIYKINYRLHEKYLIADDKAYLLGGRNIDDVSLASRSEGTNIDRDILVSGTDISCSGSCSTPPSLKAVKQYFNKIWNLPFCSDVNDKCEFDPENEKSRLEMIFDDLNSRPEMEISGAMFENMIPASEIRLLYNSWDVRRKPPVLWDLMHCQMLQGRDIIIQTPYIICNNKMYTDLEEICSSETNIRILTNSPETGANVFGCSDYLNERNRILKTGVELYEYSGVYSLHTKTVLIDDDLSIVGSFNMDMRSAYFDTELMLLIKSPDLNAELRKTFQSFVDSCLHLYPDGKKAKGCNYVYRPMGKRKKTVYSGIRVMCKAARPARKFL